MGNFLREKLAEKQEKTYSLQILTHLKNNKIKDVYDVVDYIHDFYPSILSFNKTQFSDIFTDLAQEHTDVLFLLLKNEKGQVELYQALSIFALINSDDYDKKIQFIFLLFDFDHSGSIEMKEFVCSCIAVLKGICKLAKIKDIPPHREIEEYAKQKVNLKIYKQQKYNQLDKDRSKTLSIEEISAFIQHDFEVQEFLLKYTSIFSYENAVRRFKLILFEYQQLYQSIPNSNNSIDSAAFVQKIDSQKKLLQNNGNAQQFIQLLLETSKFIQKDCKQGTILCKAFNHVVQAWAAFDACDIDKSDCVDSHELQYLIYCFEGYMVDKKQVTYDLTQIDTTKKGTVDRSHWMNYMCSGSIGMNLFKMDLQEIFTKYDKDNSGELDKKEFDAMLKELWKPIAKDFISNGKMTEEFFNDIVSGSQEDLFTFLDTDKSNTISWPEFKNFMNIYYVKEEKFKNFIYALYDPKKLQK